MTETRLYYCQGCNDHKAEEAFEFLVDKNGRRAPRKQCRVCNGSEGHKVCATCKVDKPIEKFRAERKPGRAFPLSYNKNCWQCVYARRREIGTVNYRTKKDRETYGTRRTEFAPRRNSHGNKPVGWTPPPSAEQLAALYWNAKPLPGFERPEGEQCA